MSEIYKLIWLICLVLQPFTSFSQDTLIYRSEFEKTGDWICDINLNNGEATGYSIIAGNSNGYYTIDPSSGRISINTPIADQFEKVHSDLLTIEASGIQYAVQIVDAYDYFIDVHPEYTVLDEHQQIDYKTGEPYTAYNNLWGKGTAVPGVDFRMATLVHPNLPDSTIFIWDVPSKASEYGGASVWSYMNIMWGNRKGKREDLTGYPFQVSTIQSLMIDYDFEYLLGTDDYKIALNQFFTDEDYIASHSENDGDFFMVFDQIGTWTPPYPVDLGDTIIDGHSFTRLYKEENGYEWRRVIIKDNAQLLSGPLDLLKVYNSFISKGYINTQQYIPNIQMGIEVTNGFGAVRVNKWDIQLNETVNPTQDLRHQTNKIRVYPNPSPGVFHINTSKVNPEWIVYGLPGNKVISGNTSTIDLSGFPQGFYLLSMEGQCIKLLLE